MGKTDKEKRDDIKRKCLELERESGVRITLPWESGPQFLGDENWGVYCSKHRGNIEAHHCIRCEEKGCMIYYLFQKIQNVEQDIFTLELQYGKEEKQNEEKA